MTMKTKCKVCKFAISNGEDEFNEGVCDWCLDNANSEELRRHELAERLARINSYVDYEDVA